MGTTTYVGPAGVQYAAPQYATAPYTTQVPSYVAAPAQYMTPAVLVQPPRVPLGAINPAQFQSAVNVPIAPQKLTEGIPTPQQIAAQKAQYAKALDVQLKQAIETVQKETEIEKQMIKFSADKQIALFNMQVDERLQEAIALEEEQSIIRGCELNKAKVERGLQLSSQVQGLLMDYQMKAAQTELAQKQYAFQMAYMKEEGKLEKEYNAISHSPVKAKVMR